MCMTEVIHICLLYIELDRCLLDLRASVSLLAHTGAIPGRKNRCGCVDRVEQVVWTLITPDSQPQGQETVLGISVLLGQAWSCWGGYFFQSFCFIMPLLHKLD